MGRYIPKQELSVGNEDNTPNIDENEQPVMWSDDLETPEEVFELESDEEHDNAVQNIETLEEAQQSLESLRVALVSIGIENFNKGTVTLLDNGVNQILNKFDLNAIDIGIASVEDMENNPTEAFNVSVEKISDTAKTMLEKTLAWFRDMFEKFKTFLIKLFTSVNRQIERTKKLMEAGKSTKEQANETITLPPMFSKGFNVNAIKDLTDIFRKLNGRSESRIISLFKIIDKASPEDIYKAYADTYSNVTGHGIQIVPGDFYVDSSVKKDGKLTLLIKGVEIGNAPKDNKEIKTPTVEQGLAIAKEVLALGEEIKIYKDINVKVGGRLLSVLGRITDKFEKTDTKTDTKAAFISQEGMVQSFMRGINRHAAQVQFQANNVLVQIFKPKD